MQTTPPIGHVQPLPPSDTSVSPAGKLSLTVAVPLLADPAALALTVTV